MVVPELPVNSFRRWFGASTITYQRGAEFKLDIGFNKLAVASRVDLHVSRIKHTIAEKRNSLVDSLAHLGDAFTLRQATAA